MSIFEYSTFLKVSVSIASSVNNDILQQCGNDKNKVIEDFVNATNKNML